MDGWTLVKRFTHFLFNFTPEKPPHRLFVLISQREQMKVLNFNLNISHTVIITFSTNASLVKPPSFSKYTSMSHAVPCTGPPLNTSAVIYFESSPQTGSITSQHICIYSITHGPCLHVSVEWCLFLTAKSATFGYI